MTFQAWEDATRRSRQGRAASVARFITTPRGRFLVDIIMGDGSPYYVYHTSPGIKVHDARPSSGEIDAERKWRPY